MIKAGFIFVLYQTPKKEIERLKKEIEGLELSQYKVYFIDNTVNNQGFGKAVNQGIKQGLEDNINLFIIANPDISLSGLKAKDLLSAEKHFDIWGLALKQDKKIYYGGKIDEVRFSGGLIKKKPTKRFFPCDFVSGSLMLVKKNVFEKIGFFKEDYFLYYEDVEFCYRAKKMGLRVGIDSQKSYIHQELSKDNPKKDYFLWKNRWRFFWQYSHLKDKIYEIVRLLLTFFQSLPIFWRLFIQSSFLRDFFSLNVSSLVNKVFHFLLFLFLIRHLSPSDYGIYSLVWAYLGFFNPFIDLGTTNYGLVFLPKSKKEVYDRLISLRIIIGLFVFLIFNLSSLVFFKKKEFFYYAFFVSLTIFSNVWSGTYLIINSIKQKVILSSIISTLFNIFFVLLIITFYLFSKNLFSIFMAVGLSFLVYWLINIVLVNREIGHLRLVFDYQFFINILKKSILFVFISFFAGLRYRLDVFLLNHFFSSKEVGIYSAGYKFLDALILIAGSYSIVAQPIFSRLSIDRNALSKKVKKDFVLLLLISITVSGLFFLFGPFFLPLVFTIKYQEGINIARYLVLSLPFVYLNSIFYNTLYSLNKIERVLFIFILQTIIALILNYLFIPNLSYNAPVIMTIASEFFSLVMSFSLVKYYFKRYENRS